MRLSLPRVLHLLLTVVVLGAAGPASASPPQRIGYQGSVELPDGAPAAGPVDLVVSIWNASTNGAELYHEEHTAVPLDAGVFSIEIGAGQPGPGQSFGAHLFGDADRFLEVAIDGETLTPRQRLGSVPYAFRAGAAETAALIAAVGQSNALILSHSADPAGIDGDGLRVFADEDFFGPDADALVFEKIHDLGTAPFAAQSGLAFVNTAPGFGPPETALVIKGDGRVGIGTEQPSADLDVAGDARVGGLLTADGGVRLPDGTTLAGSGDLGGGTLRRVPVNAAGTPAQNGAALLAAIAAISDASDTNRYVVALGPGRFDIGNQHVVMKPFVDVHGAGRNASVIESRGGSTPQEATVVGAPDTELRDLAIETTGLVWSVGLYVPSGPRFLASRLFITASDASQNLGVRVEGSEHALLEQLDIVVSGGATATGVHLTGGVADVRSGRILVSQGATSRGVLVEDTGFLVLRETHVAAREGNVENVGIDLDTQVVGILADIERCEILAEIGVRFPKAPLDLLNLSAAGLRNTRVEGAIELAVGPEPTFGFDIGHLLNCVGSHGADGRDLGFTCVESFDIVGRLVARDGEGDRLQAFDTNGVLRFRVDELGDVYTPVLHITGGADVSERFRVAAEPEAPAAPSPGSVLCIDPDRPGGLRLCGEAYDHTVAGVVSGAGEVAPGLLLGQSGGIADGDVPVALSGRVYVRADASAAPIRPGDLLTSADRPGLAMRAIDTGRAPGAVLGKAMTGLDAGEGLVLVLVGLL